MILKNSFVNLLLRSPLPNIRESQDHSTLETYSTSELSKNNCIKRYFTTVFANITQGLYIVTVLVLCYQSIIRPYIEIISTIYGCGYQHIDSRLLLSLGSHPLKIGCLQISSTDIWLLRVHTSKVITERLTTRT